VSDEKKISDDDVDAIIAAASRDREATRAKLELIEKTKHKLLFAPIDCAAEALTRLADAGGLEKDVAEKARGFAARLQPAVETLKEVEQDFLRLFCPEEYADAETLSNDNA
jgi:hypothetical protein